jgi:hypothetical protein
MPAAPAGILAMMSFARSDSLPQPSEMDQVFYNHTDKLLVIEKRVATGVLRSSLASQASLLTPPSYYGKTKAQK